MSIRRAWTEDEKRLANRLYTEGAPVAQIVTELGRSISSVESYLVILRRRSGLSRTAHFTPEDDELIFSLIEQGKPPSAAMPFFPGRGERAIRRKFLRMQSAGRPEPPAEPDQFTRERLNRLQDERFCFSLGRAIEAGLEQMPKSDPSLNKTHRIVRYQRAEPMSYCGSSALACADCADRA